jgi:predicted amidophosphoribosyltransferase
MCLRCGRGSFDPLAQTRCSVCDLELIPGKQCGNPICSWSITVRSWKPEATRWFEWNRAVALKTGALDKAIQRLKYHGGTGWARVLGRILAGFIESERATFDSFHLVVASPAFSEHGRVDHTRLILRRAAPYLTAELWNVDLDEPPVILKTKAVTPMVRKTWKQRNEIAVTELRAALEVPRPERIKDRAILVVDDVFTGGHTLKEIARALRLKGAERVCGVTLARQPFSARASATAESKIG